MSATFYFTTLKVTISLLFFPLTYLYRWVFPPSRIILHLCPSIYLIVIHPSHSPHLLPLRPSVLFFAFLLVFSPPAVLFRLLLMADLSSLPCTSPYLLYFSLLFSSAMHTTPVIFLTFSLVRCSRLDIPVTHLSILIQVHSIFLLFSRCPRLRPIYYCWSHYCLTRLRFRSAWHPLIGCH